MRLSLVKKMLIVLGIALPLSAVYIAPLKADDSSSLAKIIAYLANITQADNTKSSPTPQFQASFAALGAQFVSDSDLQNNAADLRQLTADIYGQQPSSFTGRSPAILKLLPNVNDLTYSSILGDKYKPVEKAPASASNYIRNAGALTINHAMPGFNWQGTVADQLKYATSYNTVMAIESYNAYILNSLAAENTNGNQLTPLEDKLVQQASGSSWIAQIASETIGQVLRQLLMFESQSYVLLTQMMKTEKQMLTAQIMTNSLLIVANQNNEMLWVARAQGVQPTG